VRKGNLLFISGLTATDDKGNVVGKGDIVAQTRQNIREDQSHPYSGGRKLRRHCQNVDYITTTEGYRGTADVRREYFRNGFPAATGIVAKELLRPDALIEIDAIAVLDEKKIGPHSEETLAPTLSFTAGEGGDGMTNILKTFNSREVPHPRQDHDRCSLPVSSPG